MNPCHPQRQPWIGLCYCTCVCYGLTIINSMFEDKHIHKCTWYQRTLGWSMKVISWSEITCYGWREGLNCQPIPIWWWVGSDGRGNSGQSWKTQACSARELEMFWGGPLILTHTSGRTFLASLWKLRTLNTTYCWICGCELWSEVLRCLKRG